MKGDTHTTESAHVRVRPSGVVHATSKRGVWHTLCGISAQDRWFYPTRNVVTCARCQDKRVVTPPAKGGDDA